MATVNIDRVPAVGGNDFAIGALETALASWAVPASGRTAVEILAPVVPAALGAAREAVLQSSCGAV